MPRAVDGTYETPSNSVAPAVASTTIDPDDFNTLITDMETALSGTVYTSAGLGGTDNRLARVDGTNGKVLQGSAIAVDDSGNMSGVGYFDIGEIAAPGSPASNTARLYCVDSAGTTKLAYKDASGTITTIETSAGGSGSPSEPQGRLTLTTAVPVLTSTVSAASTIYYALHTGRYVPLYNGSAWTMTDIGGELSQTTSDTTKSPAACTTNSNYDLFVWSDAGTYRCTRGPAWTSDTARGTGVGTTELERVQGIWVNKIAITNGPAAQRGTYVGTVRTNGTSTVDYNLGSTATGGGAALINVWNAYNRVQVQASVADSTVNWNNTVSTWRSANNSATNRISFIHGLTVEPVSATYLNVVTAGVGAPKTGINLDSTTATPGPFQGYVNPSAANVTTIAAYGGYPGLGFHYIQAMESWNTGSTYFGNGSQLLTGELFA
jgi:hypothetical protein